MPSPLKSLFNCFKPSMPTQNRESAPARHPTAFESGAPSVRQVPAELQGLARRGAEGVSTLTISASPEARARFDAKQLRERYAEVNALVPAVRHELQDSERQLGGYILGRKIDGRPVEGDALDQLKRANDTVTFARQTLRYGRGNVHVDVRDTNGQSTVRAEAGHRVGRAIAGGYSSEVRRVAGIMTAQAGNCGDHADVATFLHAGKLSEGEQVYHVGSKLADHGWAEQRAKKPNRERDLVMDPWGKGPAVFASDGEFSQNSASVALQSRYDHMTGHQAHAEMQQLWREQGRAAHAALRQEMRKLGPDYRYPDNKIWAPTPVISRAFTQRVQQKMVQPPDAAKLAPARATRRQASEPVHMDEVRMAPLRQEILATETARTLGAAGISEVVDAAKRIAYVAADLRDYPLASHPAQAGTAAPRETEE